MPRSFSSFSRSVSAPVKARTRAVFPWSIWPAVPAITCFITLAPILLSAQEIAETPIFRTGVADVKVDVQVTEAGKVVANLTKQDFSITDQGQPQAITYFGHDAEPLSLVLLLDISGSMQRWVENISATARESLGYLRPSDKVAILVFGQTLQVHQDFSDNLAESARQIASAVRDHDVGSGTHINQAVSAAAEYINSHAPVHGRRAILILTDNLSLTYNLSDQHVIRQLDNADTVLNAIVVGRGIRPGPPKPEARLNPDGPPADVFKLAEETGGEAVHADRPDVSFRDMIEHIRTRYSLSYHSPGGQPGSFRHITVHLAGEGYRLHPWADVHVRPGYYVQ